MKESFEKRAFVLSHQICYEMDNGNLEFLTLGQAKVKWSDLIIDVYDEVKEKYVKRKFIDEWICDKERRYYDRLDFYPDIEKCDKSVYNLFKGFEVEKLSKKYTFMDEEGKIKISKEERDDNVRRIREHINLITNGNEEWVCKWLGNIIQMPGLKSEVGILIRDEGSNIFEEGGGTGKNMFIDWFGKDILGERYYISLGRNKDLYSDFNSLFENKFLVYIEETNTTDNHEHMDYLKSKITNSTININKKGVAQYTVRDYSRFIFSSNNKNPLPIKQGDRRFAAFDTNKEKRGDSSYFIELKDLLEKEEVKISFYDYLRNIEIPKSQIEYQKSIPKTTTYKELR
jgi:hypothetical protein